MLRKISTRYSGCIPRIGLAVPESLLFEQSHPGRCGIDIEGPSSDFKPLLGGYERKTKIGLPEVSEGQVLRHFHRLSSMNYCIETGFYPLGSCTMKYNPRINEVLAKHPKLLNTHPLQPTSTVQGSIELIYSLADILLKVTNMDAIAMSPAAGAHGELCGMQTIARAHEMLGNTKKRYVLIPDSAHGTNPSTTTMAGFKVRVVKSNKDDARIDMDDLRKKLKDDVAAMMLTNPNCCGIFESDIKEMADLLHERGAYLYMDGANFNSFVGRAFVKDFDIDAMHINLHKTFSTPHGSSGPGSGPVVFSKRLSKYIPTPYIIKNADGTFTTVDFDKTGQSLGRFKAFYGQVGIIARALVYMLSYSNSLSVMSGDAVLNANYIKASLQDVMSLGFPKVKYCKHEALFTDSYLKGTGVSTMDIAKGLIDSGIHPPTVYFPLVVHGAMLIEPTETESLEVLDDFIAKIRNLVAGVKKDECKEEYHLAPRATPIRRADEVKAAKEPILTYDMLLKKSKKN